jgi:uncharacterized protein
MKKIALIAVIVAAGVVIAYYTGLIGQKPETQAAQNGTGAQGRGGQGGFGGGNFGGGFGGGGGGGRGGGRSGPLR